MRVVGAFMTINASLYVVE